MPEAVIVATARSPIGRAFKGSLKDLRADDLTTTIVRAALDKVPELDPGEIDDLILGCGLPGGEQGNNLGRVVAVQLGYDRLPGTTVTRYCASSLQTTRMAMHAIRAGEGDAFISAGVEMVSRYVKGTSDSLPDTRNPAIRRRATAQPGTQPGRCADLARSARRRPTARRVPGDGRDRREPRPDRGCHSTGDGRVRRWIPAPVRDRPPSTASGPRDITPVTLPDGTRDRPPTTAPVPGPPPTDWPRSRPAFRPDGRVTAGNACPLNDGAAAVIIMSDRRPPNSD